ncbi:hypothetical protein ACRALDRAFT_211537 [Sodiomyces alcalophilus JCM 7366]|uniref:uncharacterized protein n=1 Tax=Sodiomyces alcalophilus JCM 7366 TaxID=591952 RepID=UPI0039B52480
MCLLLEFTKYEYCCSYLPPRTLQNSTDETLSQRPLLFIFPLALEIGSVCSVPYVHRVSSGDYRIARFSKIQSPRLSGRQQFNSGGLGGIPTTRRRHILLVESGRSPCIWSQRFHGLEGTWYNVIERIELGGSGWPHVPVLIAERLAGARVMDAYEVHCTPYVEHVYIPGTLASSRSEAKGTEPKVQETCGSRLKRRSRFHSRHSTTSYAYNVYFRKNTKLQKNGYVVVRIFFNFFYRPIVTVVRDSLGASSATPNQEMIRHLTPSVFSKAQMAPQ